MFNVYDIKDERTGEIYYVLDSSWDTEEEAQERLEEIIEALDKDDYDMLCDLGDFPEIREE